MRLKPTALATVAAVFTAVALAASALAWISLRNAGRGASLGGILAFQLLSWHVWTLATPAVGWLARRSQPRVHDWTTLAPHLAAAVGISAVRTIVELLFLLPSEGLSVTLANVARGLAGNWPFSLLLDVAVYGAILGLATVLTRDYEQPATGSLAPLDRIPVRDQGKTIFVDVATIDWVEAADYYACLHAGGARYMVRESLARLERQLAPRRFLRVHRSAIVNLRRVAALEPHGRGDAVATLSDGTTVKVSRTNVATLRAALAGGESPATG